MTGIASSEVIEHSLLWRLHILYISLDKIVHSQYALLDMDEPRSNQLR